MQDRSTALAADAPDPSAEAPNDPAPRLPALFARYRDLAQLRYDFPLVLTDGKAGGPLLQRLTSVIDDIQRETAPPGAAGEAQRQQVLRLEQAMRGRVASGERDSLTNLWRRCAADLLAASGEPPFGQLDTSLDRAREALRVDGPVIDCDQATPKTVLVHVWQAVHRAKAAEFRKKVDAVILQLADILKADHMKSDEAHAPEALEDSVGASFAQALDFHTLSRMLSRTHPEDRLSEERTRRIRRVLMTLRSQRFYGPGRASERKRGQLEPHNFIFESAGAALDAFRACLPEMLEFVKALTVGELEVADKYRAELHDPIFERFDESDLTAEQLALLPPMLICLRDGHSDNAETVRAFEALASGLPVKVLIQTDDILGSTSPEPSRTGFGAGSARFASMAMGLHDAYVFQASTAQLCRMRDGLEAGMRYDGPALFCVYSGAPGTAADVPPYLLSAAATESRAFPSFTYDPSAGSDWAVRFRLEENPQPAADWPLHRLDYEDDALQRRSEGTAFTFADFAACDRRYARHCGPDATPETDEQIVPVTDHLGLAPDRARGRQPCILTIDAENRLHRTVVDEKIVEGARRCLGAWRLLQEFAGINNSHALRLLAREREAWERNTQQFAAAEPALSPAGPEHQPKVPAVEAAAEASAEDDGTEPAVDTGAPWIETPRCTTCNECTQINNRLFAYNENMQACIADPDAGTFRQIVEAAESCQVSIIHPGKPRDPDEPNLEQLMARAEPFN